MSVRIVQIEDSLQERTNGAIEEVEAELRRYLGENPDCDGAPDLRNDLDYSGAIHEIVDGSVPVYTSEIEATWFLHGSDLEDAYENAGVGRNPRENSGMTAIYCYIDQAVHEWYRDNADDVFEDWKEKRAAKEDKAA